MELAASSLSRSRRHVALAGIIVATIAVYAPNLTHPFQFDDENKIIEDLRVRDPWGYFRAFNPKKYNEETTRLIPNLTVSLNYVLFGLKPFGYNATNLLIHLVNIWLVARLGRAVLRRFGVKKSPIPLLAAAIFALHPLNTEAVNYCNARPNILATLFYLATLLCFLRAAWLLFAACLLATLLCKELALTIVVMIPLLHAWNRALDRPTLLKLGSAAGGLLIAGLGTGFLTGAFHEVTKRLGDGARPALARALGQSEALTAYFGLGLLPFPSFLSVDHHVHPLRPVAVTLFCAAFLAGLLAAVLLLRRRSPFAAFFLLWPLVTHAPTSLVSGGEGMVEYRTYLPMAGFCLFLAWGFEKIARARAFLPASAALLALLALGTGIRNPVWRSSTALWEDAARKAPQKARPHYALGAALMDADRLQEAYARLSEALRLKPDYAEAHCNLGIVLGRMGRLDESVAHLLQAIRLKLDVAKFHYNLGVALSLQEKMEPAAVAFEKALRVKPGYVDPCVGWANVLARQGKLPEAVEKYSEALRLDPFRPDAHYSIGLVLQDMGREDEALAHYQEAARLKPDYPEALNALGAYRVRHGKAAEGEAFLREALRLRPDYAEAHFNLGTALADQRRLEESLAHYLEADRINPSDPETRRRIEILRRDLERLKK